MNRVAVVAAVLAVASVAACKKKKSAPSIDVLIDDMDHFRAEMCACKDKACADHVMDQLNRWGEAQQKKSPDLSEAQTKRLSDIGGAYGTCYSAAVGNAGAMPAGPTPEPGGPPAGSVTNADALLKQLYDGLDGGHVVQRLDLSYIRADGTIDPKYGRVEVDLGKPKRPSPADDPDRPVGAPVPADDHMVDDVLARCPAYVWEAGKRSDTETSCGMMMSDPITRPKCSVVAIWKQAIDAGAPAAALAKLTLHAGTWALTVDDAPRNVHFQQEFPDTCAPTLEKP